MRVLFSKGIAAISKPRCGSTSVRRMLDPFLDREGGDIAVDMAGQLPPFHPHITAPFLRPMLEERSARAAGLVYFVTTRHPVAMLASYYRFFKPDEMSRYNYSPNWSGGVGMDFERWVLAGRVGMNPAWKALAPDFVTTGDLSPLSLEAHAMWKDGRLAVDHVFRIEEPDRLRDWIASKVGQDIAVRHVNQSEDLPTATLGAEALDKIRRMMPVESELYSL